MSEVWIVPHGNLVSALQPNDTKSRNGLDLMLNSPAAEHDLPFLAGILLHLLVLFIIVSPCSAITGITQGRVRI